MKMTVGEFLLRRLNEMGVNHLFGVPGDFNLAFLNQVTDSKVAWVGTCNELNAAYAADGYARFNGLAATLVTYCVGDLSALNGIGGAYAEYVPVVHISSSPPVHAVHDRALTHHSLGDGGFRNVYRAYEEFTVTQACLTPENAVAEIDRVLTTCYREKRPVRIEMPSDVSFQEIDVPITPLTRSYASSDAKMIAEATDLISKAINEAKNPVMLVDEPVCRWDAVNDLIAFAVKFNIPVAISTSINGNIPTDFPQYLGAYEGVWSTKPIQQIVESSDCLLNFGARITDANAAFFQFQLPPVTHMIQFLNNWVRVGNLAGRAFYQTNMSDLLKALIVADKIKKRDFINPVESKPSRPEIIPPQTPMKEEYLWPRIQNMIKENGIICAETGTSASALTGLKYPKGTNVVNQLNWGSIGYALPSLLGVCLAAPTRQHVLSMGDGSFQLTAQELSTIMRHKLKPVIFLLNNNGYTIERSIMGALHEYNEVHDWRYADLVHVLDTTGAGESCVVTTVGELDDAIARAQASDKLFMIEVRLRRLDMPDGMAPYGVSCSGFDYGVNGPKNDVNIAEVVTLDNGPS